MAAEKTNGEYMHHNPYPNVITKLEYSKYIFAIIAGYTKTLIGMEVMDNYLKVKNIIDNNGKLGTGFAQQVGW